MQSANAQTTKEFTLPAVGKSSGDAQTNQGSSVGMPTGNAGLVMESTSGGNKGMLIGIALIVIVMVIAFFLRGAWANHLTAKKIAPGSAVASGWCLFVLFTTLVGGSLYGLINPSVFSLIYLVPLGLTAIISLIMMLVFSGKK